MLGAYLGAWDRYLSYFYIKIICLIQKFDARKRTIPPFANVR